MQSPASSLVRAGLFLRPAPPGGAALAQRPGLLKKVTARKAASGQRAVAHLRAVARGPYGAQFDLADAIDVAAGKWERFVRECDDGADVARLPAALAAAEPGLARWHRVHEAPAPAGSGAPEPDAGLGLGAEDARPARPLVPFGTRPPAAAMPAAELDAAWARWQARTAQVGAGEFALLSLNGEGKPLSLYKVLTVFQRGEELPRDALGCVPPEWRAGNKAREAICQGHAFDTARKAHRGQLFRPQTGMHEPAGRARRRQKPDLGYFCVATIALGGFVLDRAGRCVPDEILALVEQAPAYGPASTGRVLGQAPAAQQRGAAADAADAAGGSSSEEDHGTDRSSESESASSDETGSASSDGESDSSGS